MKDRDPNKQADKRKSGENRNCVVNRTKQNKSQNKSINILKWDAIASIKKQDAMEN